MPKKIRLTATDPQSGKVFDRTTARTYTHVVLGTRDIVAARKHAENTTPDKTDLSNFRWYTFIAAQVPGVETVPPGWSWPKAWDAEAIEDAKANIEGGIEGFMARQRDRALGYHLEAVARGDYDGPVTLAWSGRLDLALKVAQAEANKGWLDVRVIPVD